MTTHKIETEASFFNTAAKFRKNHRFGLVHKVSGKRLKERIQHRLESNLNIFTEVSLDLYDFTDNRPVGLSRQVISSLQQLRQTQQTQDYTNQDQCLNLYLKAQISANGLLGTNKVKCNQTETLSTNESINKKKLINELFKQRRVKKVRLLPKTVCQKTIDTRQKTRFFNEECSKRKYLSQSSTRKLSRSIDSSLKRIDNMNQQYFDRKAIIGELDFKQEVYQKLGQKYFESSLRDNYLQMNSLKSSFVYQIKDEIKKTPFICRILREKPNLLLRQRLVIKATKKITPSSILSRLDKIN